MSATLDAAIGLAAEGYSIFPCIYGTKEPAVRRGFYSASANPATIGRWFGGTVEYNLAIRTGMASGIWVLDIDPRHGGDKSLAELEREHGALPPTRAVKTADGWHLWWLTDCPIQSSDNRVAQGIGVKGDGTYAIAPPSLHPDGVFYEWISTAPPVYAPDWLVRLTIKPQPPPYTPPPRPPHVGSPGAYGTAALDRETEELANCPRGGRNNETNLKAFRLGQLVAGGELDGAEVERRLIEACHANGLMTDRGDGPRKTMATIRSGMRAGLQFPRSRRSA